MKQEDDLHLALEQLVRRHARKSAPELAGLLYEDYHARVNEGGRPDRDVYLNSAPVLRDLLSRFFDVHDALGDESLADEIAQLTVDPVHDANEPSEVMLGDFQIVREISRSVMGTVYEAEQVSLQRKVALKTLHRLFGLDSGRRRRFLIEAQLAATLQIDGIVPVLSAGEQEGICYYTMPFIEGHTLSEVFLKKDQATPEETADRNGNHRSPSNLPSDPKQIAMLLVGVSRALHAAHEQGIVHRDIKPSNILIDQNHKAWLSDFGLARSPDAETLTKTGDLLGTYHYMSPEQVTGSAAKVDRRSDIYSLGATLYETIAGQPPFADQKPPRLIQSIIESDPTALRKLHPEVPRPLHAIVRKAMSKSPADRYDTSAEFADDLERYVRDKPVLADAGVWTEGRRWWRQHQRTMLIMAVTLATAVLGLFFGMQTRLTQLRKLNHDLVRSEQQSANLRYANHMQLAYHAVQARNFPRAKELVERHGQPNSGFEHQLLANHLRQYTPDLVLRGHRRIVQDLAFAPSTRQLISTSEDQTICFWNLASGELVERIEVDDVVSAVAISPDGQSIGLGIGDRAELWDLMERQPIRVIAEHKAGVESIAFSPDGALIASGTRYESIHVNTPEGLAMAQVYSGSRVEQLEFSRDGKTLYGSKRTQSRPVKVDGVTAWHLDDGQLIPTTSYEYPNASIRRFEIDESKNRLLATRRYGGGILAFDLNQGRLLFSRPTLAESNSWTCGPDSAAFGAPNGQVRILYPADASAEVTHRWQAHEGYVESMMTLPDGRLVTGGQDGLVKVWPKPRAFLTKQRLKEEPLVSPTIIDDGERVAYLDSDRKHVHLLAPHDGTTSIVELPDQSCHFSASPDSKSFVSFAIDEKGEATHLVAATAKGTRESHARYYVPNQIHTAQFSPSGNQIAVGDARGGLALVRADDLELIWKQQVGGCVWNVAFASSGDRIACGTDHGKVAILRVEDGRKLASFDVDLGSEGTPTCLAWSHDDRFVAVAGRKGNHSISICRLEPEPIVEHVLMGHDAATYALRFSLDDRTLVSISADRTLRFWNMKAGELAGVIQIDAQSNFFAEGLQLFSDSIAAIVGTETATELWHWNASFGDSARPRTTLGDDRLIP